MSEPALVRAEPVEVYARVSSSAIELLPRVEHVDWALRRAAGDGGRRPLSSP